jgi:hypothetical protein
MVEYQLTEDTLNEYSELAARIKRHETTLTQRNNRINNLKKSLETITQPFKNLESRYLRDKKNFDDKNKELLFITERIKIETELLDGLKVKLADIKAKICSRVIILLLLVNN